MQASGGIADAKRWISFCLSVSNGILECYIRRWLLIRMPLQGGLYSSNVQMRSGIRMLTARIGKSGTGAEGQAAVGISRKGAWYGQTSIAIGWASINVVRRRLASRRRHSS